MRRTLRLLMPLLALLASIGSAQASTVWWHGDAAIARFEPASGQLQTLTLPARVRALASTPDGGVWVVYGDALTRFGADLVPATTVLIPAPIPAMPTLVATDSGGGVWLAQGDAVLHYDSGGVVVSTWRHSAPIRALAVGGPDAIFVGDREAIHHYNDHGEVVRAPRLHEADAPTALLLDAPGGYVWLLGREVAVQYDALVGLTERARVTLAEGTTAAALDVATGALWFLSQNQLVSLDRQGVQVDSLPVSPGAADTPLALAFERAADRLWIGDLRGTTAFNRQSLQWIRLTDGEATVGIAGAFAATTPRSISSV